MSISDLEARITPKLKWRKIEEIPNFPLNDFADVKGQVETGQYSLGIDYSVANQLAQWLYGRGHAILVMILTSTPFIVAIASVVLAFALKNYWLLAGVLLGFSGQFLSNPYNPLVRFLKPIVGLLFLVFLYGVWQGKETIAYLSGFFVFPFVINDFMYRMNQNKLKRVSMESEMVLIYLYQIGALGLKDSSNQRMYWHRESQL